MSKYALPALGRSAGTIVNIASYVGLVGFHGAAAYAASKAALVSLTRCTALDHAHEGGRVNCVCPGSVDTDMIHQAWRRHGNIEEARHVWAAKHPSGAWARRRRAPGPSSWPAEASFISGAVLPVDGGIAAT